MNETGSAALLWMAASTAMLSLSSRPWLWMYAVASASRALCMALPAVLRSNKNCAA